MKKLIVLSIASFAFVACLNGAGQSEKDGGAPTSGSSSAATGRDASDGPVQGDGERPSIDGGASATSDASSENLSSCVSSCETKYPAAATKSKQLDATCMLGGSCESVCNDLVPTGKNFPPDANPDGGTACDTADAGSYPITTPSAACSTCIATTKACCSLWVSIFGSQDGQALSSCSSDCYAKFQK